MSQPEMITAPPARLPFPITRAVGLAVESRTDDGSSMPTMVGQFSTFGDWYEVHSLFEGHFIERIAKGAFTKTIRESRDLMKVLFDHGMDPQIGNKVLGPIRNLYMDARYEVPLFDTSYNRDLAPGLEAGVYGSSFRFTVEKDSWDYTPEASDANPEGLPERTITEARVYEFGPVTFPANPNATAGVRSTTDAYYRRSRDPGEFDELLRSATSARTSARAEAAAPESDEPPDDTPRVNEEPSQPDTQTTDDEPDDEPAATIDEPEGTSDSRGTKVETIEEKRARHDELNESLAEQAKAYPGVLPEDEQVRWNADVKERDDLKRDLDAWEARQAVLVAAATSGLPGTTERTFTPPTGVNQINRKSVAELHSPESRSTTFEGRVAEFRDDAMQILERTSFPTNIADSQRSRDRIADLLDHHDSPDGELARRIKFTGAPIYMRAFEKIIKAKGSTIGLSPDEQRGTALAVGVDATGGFAVPFAFDPTVIAIGVNNGAVNPYRATCRVVTIVGTDTWNAVTATAVVATRTTEAAASTEQGPTFAQPQYIVKRVQGQITASFEMFQDRTDLASEMAALIQEAKDNEEETSWATGNGAATASIGVGPVTGTSGSYTRVSTAGAGAVTAADFDTLETAVPVRHRFRAQWFANRLNIRRAQAVETAGGKLFQQSQYFQSAGNVDLSRTGNTGLRLLNYPVNESPSLPTSTATTITGFVLLNVDQYVIVDRVGLSVQFIPFILNSASLATGQQALYFLYRNHAAPLNTDSGRILQYL